MAPLSKHLQKALDKRQARSRDHLKRLRSSAELAANRANLDAAAAAAAKLPPGGSAATLQKGPTP